MTAKRFSRSTFSLQDDYPVFSGKNVPKMSATGGTVTTSSGFTTHTFTTAGQSSFVMTGTGILEVFLWGAGGGGGTVGGWSFGSAGGGGGFAYGKINITVPRTLTIMVGGGGAVNGLGFTQGGGAAGTNVPGDNRYGSQGGGLSGIFDGTYVAANAVIIAGGGGGGGSSRAGVENWGGAGGGINGQDGNAPYDNQLGRRGRGGSQAAVGANPTDANSTLPTQLAGGIAFNYGGGGGGGWYGGSAGAYAESNTMGGGGGGSGYINTSKVTDGSLGTGVGSLAAARTHPLWSNYGNGGAVATAGTNGAVIIRYDSY